MDEKMDETMPQKKHYWIMSTRHPDICADCGAVRGGDVDKEPCVPDEGKDNRVKVPA